MIKHWSKLNERPYALSDNETAKKRCCLSLNRDVKYWVERILNSRENRKRGAFKAKETKQGRSNLYARFASAYPNVWCFCRWKAMWQKSVKNSHWRRCRKGRAYLWKNPGYAPAKARKNNRSLELSYHLSGVALSRKRWSRIIHDEMKTSRSFQRKNEWQQCSGKRSFCEM